MNLPLFGRIAPAVLVAAAVAACSTGPAATPSATPAPPATVYATVTPTDTPEPATPTPTRRPTEPPTPAPTPTETVTPGATPNPLVAKFIRRISDPAFQFQGRIAGAARLEYDGRTSTLAYSGTMKVKGRDEAVSMTVTTDGTHKTTAEQISVGSYDYFRSNGGEWSKTARGSSSPPFGSISIVRDAGFATWRGARLHKLVAGTAWGSGSGLSITISDFGSGPLEVAFWVRNDGTPAGWSEKLDYRDGSSGMTLTLDVIFDRLSGVTIKAPPGV